MTTPSAIIEATNIEKRFGSIEVLRKVSISIPSQQITAIVGPSGAGKTTLLQILGTLDPPNAGTLRIAGHNPLSMSRKRQAQFRNKHIGFVFQFHQLLPEFTAAENVAIPAMIAGVKKKEALQAAEDLLADLGLSKRILHKPSQLSGGEKQRVAVARALINQPSVILADEPSGSLDTERKQELHQLFFNLCRERHQTFVIVTHDTELAQMAHHTITLKDGQIAHSSSRDTVHE